MMFVKFAEKAPYPRKVAKKACVKEGLEFEAKAQRFLEKLGIFGKPFHSKWIAYDNGDGLRHAQPDSFFILNDRIFLFEMKLRHTPRSAPQLVSYRDLLQCLYPEHKITLIEVYKYWDWVVYPAKHQRVEAAEMVLGIDDGVIALLCLDVGS
jgi:hypothetical protein